MLPLARELLQRGTAVILAANSVHSINDVTAAELRGIVTEAATLDPILNRAWQVARHIPPQNSSNLGTVRHMQIKWFWRQDPKMNMSKTSYR